MKKYLSLLLAMMMALSMCGFASAEAYTPGTYEASVNGMNGHVVVTMEFSDPTGVLMHLELTAPSIPQGHRLEKTFRERAESIYKNIISEFLKDQDDRF